MTTLTPTQALTVNVPGAAALLQIHPKTVLDLISQGVVPAAKVGRSYVMLTSDILHIIKSMIAKQTSDRMRLPHRRGEL